MHAVERDAAGIGALADPVRRSLYEFVCTQPDPVSRDQAADAVAIPRHQAKFHLDRLEHEGLLESDYARLGGRTGPGAGRTSKLYRRARREIAVSLPPREYQLAGQLMADAIAEATATGAPVVDILHRIANEHGRSIADAARAGKQPPADDHVALQLASAILSDHGYEPRPDDDRVYLINCPFHALANVQTELICQMNHALVSGVADTLQPHCPDAALSPDAERCCVVLSTKTSTKAAREAGPSVDRTASGPVDG